MTLTHTDVPPPAHPPLGYEGPRVINVSLGPADLIFRIVVRGIGLLTLLMTGAIAWFLGSKFKPTFDRYGSKFFTRSTWNPETGKIGIAGAVVGTTEIAIVAVVVGFPLALMTALYISEYAPPRIRASLVALVDLLAAVPSIIFGLWGFFALEPQAWNVSRWISQHFGWIPIFKVNTDPNAPSWAKSSYTGSVLICGVCVGMMIVPLACSVMRGVFVLAPIGEKEAAYALGSTRWGMVRAVVLPFGRGGIIGGTMLGLGRALGETIAVLLVFHYADGVKFKILTQGTSTISALIAQDTGEATGPQLDALIAAGFVLFMLTLGINTIAAIFVSRSRSGASA